VNFLGLELFGKGGENSGGSESFVFGFFSLFAWAEIMIGL